MIGVAALHQSGEHRGSPGGQARRSFGLLSRGRHPPSRGRRPRQAGGRHRRRRGPAQDGRPRRRVLEHRRGSQLPGARRIEGSASLPVEAALSMVNRNTRNRATLGGNLGADKSCSSLIPILIALGADGRASSRRSIPNRRHATERLGLEAWLSLPRPRRCHRGAARGGPRAPRHRAAARGRPAPPTGDGIGSPATCRFSAPPPPSVSRAAEYRDLRLALGGLGPKARRFPEIEALFEGSAPAARARR